MEFDAKQLIQLVVNLGSVVTFALLFWRHIVKQTDLFIEKMDKIEQRHRTELTAREDIHNKERNQREQELKLLTEKAIETMTRIEQIFLRYHRVITESTTERVERHEKRP